MWEVITEYISDWLDTLDDKTAIGVFGAIEVLQQEGPQLKRPLVGEIVGSKHKGMKELRPGSSGKSEIRILFIFDPERNAIMLLGGDKSKDWGKWYKDAILRADAQYDAHLLRLEKEAKKTNEENTDERTSGSE